MKKEVTHKDGISESNKKLDTKRKSFWLLGLLLVGVVIGSVVFIGAVAGWFGGVNKAVVDTKYHCETAECDFVDISGEEYEKLINNGESFVVFVDQDGCVTANRVRGFLKDYMSNNNMMALRIMFDDMKKTSLHDYVKFYPSVVVVSKGKVLGYLRADADEDAEAYNEYDAFLGWMQKFLQH